MLLVDPLPPDPTRPFDAVGAILSAVGMFFVVFGILQAGTNNVLLTVFVVLGVAFLIGGVDREAIASLRRKKAPQ